MAGHRRVLRARVEVRPLSETIQRLLAGAGIHAPVLEVSPVAGGGNNKVFAVRTASEKLLAKHYFSDPADTRDRLRAEFAFLSYAHGIGVRCVPRPVACDAAAHVGLYEYVEGGKLGAGDVTREHVAQAARFVLALNLSDRRAGARDLPPASASGFSVEQHLARVEGRIGRLLALRGDSPADGGAAALAGRLAGVLRELRASLTLAGAAVGGELQHADRCVSPSDFGFHNALLRAGGEVVFIDFEYAGWDDPAKLVCDFFAQPAVSVSLDHFEEFLRVALGYSGNADLLAERARLLLPLVQLEWCCILLNEFLPDAASRRRFADPELVHGVSRRRQLEKAQVLFNSTLG